MERAGVEDAMGKPSVTVPGPVNKAVVDDAMDEPVACVPVLLGWTAVVWEVCACAFVMRWSWRRGRQAGALFGAWRRGRTWAQRARTPAERRQERARAESMVRWRLQEGRRSSMGGGLHSDGGQEGVWSVGADAGRCWWSFFRRPFGRSPVGRWRRRPEKKVWPAQNGGEGVPGPATRFCCAAIRRLPIPRALAMR